MRSSSRRVAADAPPPGPAGPGPLGARGVQDVRDPSSLGDTATPRPSPPRPRARAAPPRARRTRPPRARRTRRAASAAAQVLGAGAHDADELGALLVALPVEPARWFSCLCCRHLRRIAERARGRGPPVARGELIGRGAANARRRLVVALLQSITGRATSSRSMGGASGNAEHRRSVITSLRRYSSLCFRAEGKGAHGRWHTRGGRLGLVFARNETRARRAPRDREIRGRAGKPRGFRGAHLEVLRAELDLPLHRCRRHLGAVGREGDPPETLGAVPTAMLKSLSELRRSSPGAPRTRRESARV